MGKFLEIIAFTWNKWEKLFENYSRKLFNMKILWKFLELTFKQSKVPGSAKIWNFTLIFDDSRRNDTSSPIILISSVIKHFIVKAVRLSWNSLQCLCLDMDTHYLLESQLSQTDKWEMTQFCCGSYWYWQIIPTHNITLSSQHSNQFRQNENSLQTLVLWKSLSPSNIL